MGENDMHGDDDEGCFADALTRDQAQSVKDRHDWAADYDGTTCPNCNRLRMMKSNNGKRRCEKCNWDPDANDYSEGPHVG